MKRIKPTVVGGHNYCFFMISKKKYILYLGYNINCTTIKLIKFDLKKLLHKFNKQNDAYLYTSGGYGIFLKKRKRKKKLVIMG